MCHNLSDHSAGDGHWGALQFGTIMNSAALNVLICVSVDISTLVYFISFHFSRVYNGWNCRIVGFTWVHLSDG